MREVLGLVTGMAIILVILSTRETVQTMNQMSENILLWTGD